MAAGEEIRFDAKAPLHPHRDRQSGAAVVRFIETDLSVPLLAEGLESELTQLIGDLHPALVVVDFTDVKTITSSVIGVLLTTRRKLLQEGGRLRLCCVPLPIHEVYRTLNLDRRILPVFESLEMALGAPDLQVGPTIEQMED